MKEYIEREQALKAACFWCAGNVNLSDDEPCSCEQREEIFNIPAADVVEVKHGEWIMHTNFDGYLNHYECSVCHQSQGHLSNYCEECGAKMDGGKK